VGIFGFFPKYPNLGRLSIEQRPKAIFLIDYLNLFRVIFHFLIVFPRGLQSRQQKKAELKR